MVLQISHISRRIGWRESPSVPLNCHFVAADVREVGAEMSQLRRDYGSNPPLCKFGSCMADAREKAAECAKLVISLQSNTKAIYLTAKLP